MARENQGLQIALIIFVILTILLGGFTYFFFSQYKEAEQRAEAFDAEAKKLKATNTGLAEDIVKAKQHLGFDPGLDMEQVTEEVNKDMNNCKPFGVQGEPLSYHVVISQLINKIAAKDSELAQERADLATWKDTYVTSAAQKDTQVAKFATDLTQFQQEKTTAIAKLNAEYNRVLQDEKAILAEQVREKKNTKNVHEEIAGKLRDAIQEKNKFVDIAKIQGKKLQGLKNDTFETADGQIGWVDPARQLVWINLGAADGLTRGVTFSVYPADTTNLAQGGKKASVEVTLIRDDHLSVARITEQLSMADPILIGDKLHTPVWERGQRKRFALTGLIDLDDDERSDVELVKKIITMNGGVVDSWIDDNGAIQGKMSAETTYLVLGKNPSVAAAAQGASQMVTSHTVMRTEAERFGVQTIGLAELLKQMGWKNQTPVVRFGRGAPTGQTAPRTTDGVPRISDGNVTDYFRNRRPPGTPKKSGSGGAY